MPFLERLAWFIHTFEQALYALDDSAAQPEVDEGVGDDAFFAQHAPDIEHKLRQARLLRDELGRAERQRDELSRQVSHLEREAVVTSDEMEKTNDDLAGVQAERDLLERKVNELRRELHAKNKEIEAVDAELKLSKSQNVRAMARMSVQKAKAEKQLAGLRKQLKTLDADKSNLFREVTSLEAQLSQARPPPPHLPLLILHCPPLSPPLRALAGARRPRGEP